MKKFFALVLALAMVMSLALPAMAAEETYDLTINNTAPKHTYDAYQIFSGTLSTDGTVLSNVTWGSAIKDGDALITALTTDTEEIVLGLNSKTTLSEFLAGVTDLNGLLIKMKEMDPEGSLLLARMAKIIGEYKDGEHTYLIDSPTGSTNVHVADSKYVIEDLSAGYYLVKDRDGSLDVEDMNKGDFYSDYMINIVTVQSIDVKGEGVTVEKKINDTLNNTYGDVEDFDIYDTAYYMWNGKLPDNLLSYDKFFYEFVDTLPYGIEFERLEAVYVQDDDGNRVHTFYDINHEDEAYHLMRGEFALSVNNIGADNESLSANAQDRVQERITLTFNDLLTAWSLIQPDHEVVVKYSTIVTRNALMATPMDNEVYVNYDNNPNGSGRGQSTPDHAHAFTYEVTVDKYDAANESKKLAGAEFILYFTRIENEQTVQYYAQVVTEEVIYQVGNDGKLLVGEDGKYILRVPASETDDENKQQYVINGKVLIPDYLGNIYGWTTIREEASILDTDENGHLNVEGLDAGTYYLEETKEPNGYNKLNSAITVEIKPTYGLCDGTGADCGGVTVEYKVDNKTQGENSVVKVPNSAGAVLPTTGGMGTTLFYVFGGLMVAAAAVLLVTKKRMSAEN